MPTLSELKTDLFGIGDVLKANLLSVPRYQRSYAWMDKNVTDLFHGDAGLVESRLTELEAKIWGQAA